MEPADAVSFAVLSAVTLAVWWIYRKRCRSKERRELLDSFVIGGTSSLFLTSFALGMLLEIEQSALIGIATIIVFSYLPFAVVLLQSSDDEFHWDKQVLLDRVINLPLVTVLLVLGLILPILFWPLSADKPAILAFLFGLFVATISVYLRSIFKVYGWIVNTSGANRISYRGQKRLDYLSGLPSSRKRDIWSTKTWRRLPDQPIVEQEELLKIFGQHIQGMKSNEDKAVMIDDLASNLHLMPLYLYEVYGLVFDLAFPRSPSLGQSNGLPYSLSRLETKLVDISFGEKDAEYDQRLQAYLFDRCRVILGGKSPSEQESVARISKLLFNLLYGGKHTEIDYRNFFQAGFGITVQKLTSEDKTPASILLDEYGNWVTEGMGKNNIEGAIEFVGQPAWETTGWLMPLASTPLWFHLLNMRILTPNPKGNQARRLISSIVTAYSGTHYVRKSTSGFVFEGEYETLSYSDMSLRGQCKETVKIYILSGMCALETSSQVDKYLKVALSMANEDGDSKKGGKYRNLSCLIMVLRILKSYI